MTTPVSCANCGQMFDRTESGWATYQEHVETRHPHANPHTTIRN